MSKTLGMIMKHNVKVMAALVAVVMAGALPVRAGEYDAATRNIAAVASPAADPVAGGDGPLRRLWC